MTTYENPFPADPDRQAIWEMLVERDIKAFVRQDWGIVAGDFIEEGFMGVDGKGSAQPDSWRLSYSDLSSYRDEWLRQANDTADTNFAEDLESAILNATTLYDIEISGDCALAHKKFDGRVQKEDGGFVVLDWQSVYRCRKVGGTWKIAGFVGYLPNLIREGSPMRTPAKRVPKGATQHVTAGPYSSVLEVRPGHLVVIAGQAAIDPDGTIIGDTIEEQTRFTLENCRSQLATAGCTFIDVFKVNVYLTDLSIWDRFNVVYRSMMPEPRPVRTAVGTKLLPGLQVEIEMWAVRK